MSAREVLRETVRQRHAQLVHELGEVRDRFKPGGTDLAAPREVRGMVDRLLADVSQHVNSVSAVLVPLAKRKLGGGKDAVHKYLHDAKEIEVALAHFKAHAYGSTYESKFSWTEAWQELQEALGHQRDREEELARHLDEVMSEEESLEVADRLHRDEPKEPTRPHPYAPHSGVLGAMTRMVMRRVDAFWDDAEGRMVRREEKHHKRPGLIGRYIMARPQIDED